jgi:hypothetical protein
VAFDTDADIDATNDAKGLAGNGILSKYSPLYSIYFFKNVLLYK